MGSYHISTLSPSPSPISITPLHPNQYLQLESPHNYQLWFDLISTRKYMVYALDQTSLTQHNLQIYHFRKLNKAYLIGINSIFKQYQSICSFKSSHLLFIQYLPFSLIYFHKKLTLKDCLIVIKIWFIASRITGFIFGPLLPHQDMIWFTQNGIPKIWINDLLQRNQPSWKISSLEKGNEGFQTLDINDKKKMCIMRLMNIMEGCLREGDGEGLPRELREGLEGVGSYEEGEEVVEMYCKGKGIQLDDWIDIDKCKEIVKEKKQCLARLKRIKSNQESLNINQNGTNFPIVNMPPQKNYQNYNKPPLQLSLNNPKIQFHYNQSLPQPSHSHNPNPSIPHIIPTILSNQSSLNNKSSNSHKKSIKITYSNNFIPSFITPQQIITQTIINSKQNNLQYQQRIFQTEKRISLKPRVIQYPSIELRTNEHLIDIKTNQKQSIKHIYSPKSQQFNYQLDLHSVSDNSNSYMQTDRPDYKPRLLGLKYQQVKTSRPREIVQNISQQSSGAYRSQERDEVIIQEPYSKTQITNFKNLKFNNYAQNDKNDRKFDQNEQQNQKQAHKISMDKYIFKKKALFTQNISKVSEQPKYTFGKIQVDVKNAILQYQNASRKTSQKDIEQSKDTNKYNNTSNIDQIINERYSKYVVNRDKNIKERRTKNLWQNRHVNKKIQEYKIYKNLQKFNSN